MQGSCPCGLERWYELLCLDQLGFQGSNGLGPAGSLQGEANQCILPLIATQAEIYSVELFQF